MWTSPPSLTTFVPVIEHLQEAACLESADGRTAVVNGAWVELFRGAPALVALREVPAAAAWEPVTAAFDPATGLSARIASRRRGRVASTPEPLSTVDDRSVEWDHSPIFVRGALAAHLWRFRDATRQRRLEESVRQGQRLNTVGRLAGGIAHDFNNLLTAVLGYCDLLDTQFDNGDPRRFDLHEIRNAATRAAALTRQLLAFSRRQVMQPEIVDVAQMVSELSKMLARLMGEQVRVTIDVPPEGAEVFADPGQVEQVVFSLAANARDAMPDGGTLRIEVARTHVDGGRAEALGMRSGPAVQISVIDDGSGMDEATRASAFDPFFTTKPLAQGLGLPTVYGIVRQTGGAVWIDSTPGVGTRVEILLPQYVDAVGTSPSADLAAARQPEPARSGPAVVLAVEDEASVLRLVRRVLESEGMVVLSAQDAEEALLLASQHGGHIDLLLTDVVMPGQSGLDLARSLASSRPGTKVLFMSGYADHALVQRDIVDAGRPFLQKPFAPDRLVSRVHEVLRGHAPL